MLYCHLKIKSGHFLMNLKFKSGHPDLEFYSQF